MKLPRLQYTYAVFYNFKGENGVEVAKQKYYVALMIYLQLSMK